MEITACVFLIRLDRHENMLQLQKRSRTAQRRRETDTLSFQPCVLSHPQTSARLICLLKPPSFFSTCTLDRSDRVRVPAAIRDKFTRWSSFWFKYSSRRGSRVSSAYTLWTIGRTEEAICFLEQKSKQSHLGTLSSPPQKKDHQTKMLIKENESFREWERKWKSSQEIKKRI